MKQFNAGDIVKHFKYETLTSEEQLTNKYLYCVRELSEHTETGEQLITYQALYRPFQTYTRPLKMFCSEVDCIKYPHVKQKHRFEKYTQE